MEMEEHRSPKREELREAVFEMGGGRSLRTFRDSTRERHRSKGKYLISHCTSY